MTAGRIVISKRGRDKGMSFVIMAVENEYLYLADGAARPLAKPKKKKMKHVQLTRHIVDLAAHNGRGLQDADIRKYLKEVNSVV